MPIPVRGNEERSIPEDLKKDLGYRYPDKLDLKPSSKLHARIVAEVMQRARDSYNVISARHPSWSKVDEVLTAYIRSDDKEKVVVNKDDRKPISIVIPQSYATLEILLTYMTAALLEFPIIRYEGSGPEDIIGALLLQKVVEQQLYYSKAPLALHTMFRDAFAYGLGAITPYWTTETGIMTRAVQRPAGFFDQLLGRSPSMMKQDVESILYEGNVVDNIDPYRLLPDPNVPINKIQEGEFVGWIERTNILALLADEKDNSNLFNVRYLRGMKGTSGISGIYKTDPSGRNIRSGISDPTYTSSSATVDLVKMYVQLIPEDWGLPGGINNRKGNYPETWLFEVAADSIVIRADRLNLNHNRKPVLAYAPDYDGYSVAPISRLEMIHGLQTTLNWLFNSHIANVRKAINDMLIVDPSLVNMKDLDDPSPGKLVRLRRAAWGRGVDNAVKQLTVNDITKQHLVDSQVIVDLIKSSSGAVDAVSGLRRKSSERVTAAEVSGDRTSGLSRLERLARICSWMVLQDLGMMLASHTQQFMSQETYIKITGNWEALLIKEYGIQPGARMTVSPYDLLVNYDTITRDGSVPSGNFSEVWVQLLPMLSQNPELMQGFDLVRVVKHIMRNAGAKDVDQFDRPKQIQPQVVPDEQALQQAAAGNLVPANGYGEMANVA